MNLSDSITITITKDKSGGKCFEFIRKDTEITSVLIFQGFTSVFQREGNIYTEKCSSLIFNSHILKQIWEYESLFWWQYGLPRPGSTQLKPLVDTANVRSFWLKTKWRSSQIIAIPDTNPTIKCPRKWAFMAMKKPLNTSAIVPVALLILTMPCAFIVKKPE